MFTGEDKMKTHTMFLYKHSVESNGIYLEAETLEEAIFDAKTHFDIRPDSRILIEEYHCVHTTPYLISDKSV